MRLAHLVMPLFVLAFVACNSASDPTPTSDPAPTAKTEAQLTLTSAAKERVTGVYTEGTDTLTFDFARVGDELFADLKGNGGRSIVRIETTNDEYVFTYMGGALKLHTTKAFIAQARAQAQVNPNAVSSDGLVFEGDRTALDAMLALPEVARLPALSRELGVRSVTGSDYPASLALHKMARQSADALGIHVAPLEVQATGTGYCEAYPNAGDSCYGMCGPGCSCWSWVCGDCCYHYGCAVHDSWCRQGKWWYCYNITAVIAFFGC